MKTPTDSRAARNAAATRLALGLTAVSALALALLALVSLLALNLYFESRDRDRLHAHLAQARVLVARVDQTAALTLLPRQLFDEFGDERDLAVRVQGPLGQPLYEQGAHAEMPASLLGQPSAAAQPAPLVSWRQDGRAWRGSAMLMRLPLEGAAPLTVAVAVDIQAQAAFVTSAVWVLAGYVLLASLVLALLARWLAGRALAGRP
ncbi:MAG: hypothetical protein Q4G70_10555 [Pseudomonadota bacterium]|nr:hypothetical protein [Pseudomonadota bacterium]